MGLTIRFQIARRLKRLTLPNLRHLGLGGGPLDEKVMEKITVDVVAIN